MWIYSDRFPRGLLDRPGRYARLAVEYIGPVGFLAVQGTLLRIGSGDIKALCPEFLGLYIAVDGVVGSRGDSKVPIEPRPSKTVGTARLISK